MRTLSQRAAMLALATIAIMSTTTRAGEDAGVPASWKSFDGAEFPVLEWLPAGGAKPAAAVVCVHGLSGAADDYEQLGVKLAAAGNAVYAYNLRGQGNDPDARRVGDIKKREHWFADLDSFLSRTRALHPGTPLFVYGESLGSLIVMHGFCHLSEENREAVSGVVYGSPVVSLPGDLPPVKYFFVKTLIKLCPGFKVSILKLAGDQAAQVTGDEEVDHWAQMRKTPHFVERLSFRLLGTIEGMVRGCEKAASAIEKPVLVLYPGHDLFTTPAEVEAFFEALGSDDKAKRLFADSHHLLFYDDEREELFDLVEKWIGKRS